MAIDFEASSSHWADMGDDLPVLSGKAAATLMVWVIPESTVATMGVLGVSIGPPPGGSAQSRCVLEIRSNNIFRLSVRAIDGGSSVFLDSVAALTDGVRAHIAGVVDLANDIFEIYIDGVLDASSTPSFTPTAWPSTNSKNGALGAKVDGGSEFYDGILEDARFYARRLSAAELATIHATQGVDGIVADHRYPLNEGHEGKTATGAGSVKDLGSLRQNADPTASPVYVAGGLRFRRKVA